jgi:NRAMP (natural resistance-associated macrophage protein)-like metal ion transporter
MATDLAEVIGSAIALKLLFNLPLPYGVMITTLDVFIILFGYQPNNPRIARIFEFFIFVLVTTVVCCFVYLLARSDIIGMEVLAGFLPTTDYFTNVSSNLVVIAMGIVGATVMPHNLYLHSSAVKVRAAHIVSTGKGRGIIGDKEHESSSSVSNDSSTPLSQSSLQFAIPLSTPRADGFSLAPGSSQQVNDVEAGHEPGKTSERAINVMIRYSFADLFIALLLALFVNSAILIVAGANLYDPDNPSNVGELSDAYHLLRNKMGAAAATTFAFALLIAGQSSTITGTLAGQVLMEGFLGMTMRPWLRRIITRGIAIIPAMVVAVVYGDKGLNRLLIISQVVLSAQVCTLHSYFC